MHTALRKPRRSTTGESENHRTILATQALAALSRSRELEGVLEETQAALNDANAKFEAACHSLSLAGAR